MADYDVIVVGGGHNGLVAGAYAARASLKTLVLEKTDRLGGMCQTIEFMPGFKANIGATGCAYWLRPTVIEELELNKYGLNLVPNDPWYTHVFPGGKTLTIYPDVERTCEEIARYSKHDAENWKLLFEKWAVLREMMDMAMDYPPPPWPDAVGGMCMNDEMLELWQEMYLVSMQKTLDTYFESEIVRCAILAWGQSGATASPAGYSQAMFLFHFCLAPAWKRSIGGMGVIVDAIVQAAEAQGANIKTNSPVARILVKDGKAYGVKLESGEEITARVVMANTDLHNTFFKLIDEEEIPDAKFIRRAKAFKFDSYGVTLNIALSEFPDLPIAREKLHTGFFTIGNSQDAFYRAYHKWEMNEMPDADEFAFEAFVAPPEDRFAPEGKYTLVTWVMPVPYDLKEGDWHSRKQEFIDKAIDGLTAHAPNIKKSVLGTYVLTPAEMAEEWNVTRGDAVHGRQSWDQMNAFRPVIGYSSYRMPIKNLYLCGSSAYSGGGVTGVPGHNATMVMLDDLKQGLIT